MIDLKKNKTYCPYLFRGAVTSMPRLEIVPCCRFDLKLARQELEGDQMYPTTFNEGYDNMWKSVRQKSLNGETIKACWRCYDDESKGIESMRTGALQHHENADKYDCELSYYSQDQIDYTQPTLQFLEIQTGRFCNLKCRSCGPSLSTTWDEDLANNKKAVENFYGGDESVYTRVKQLPKTNQYLSDISKDTIKNLTRVKVTGGEPFLNDQFQTFLANLVKWDLAKNITIEVITNCSFFPKVGYRRLLVNFKSVKITLSLDGIKERAEFLRKRSVWSKVESSAKKWLTYCQENNNTRLSINHTITIYNVLYIKEFLEWMIKFFPIEKLGIRKLNFEPTIASTPKYLAVANQKNNTKLRILQILEGEFDPFYNKHKLLKNEATKLIVRRVYDKCITVLQSSIESNNTSWKDLRKNALQNKHTHKLTEEFYEKTALFDSIRNEDWRGVFPELAEIIDE